MMTSLAKPPIRRITPVVRKNVRVRNEPRVRFGSLSPGDTLPLVVRPAGEDTDLMAWARENRCLIEDRLLQHGGILFRDFSVSGLSAFQQFLTAVGSDLLDYTYRSTPRREVQGRIYTSTEFPANQEIPMHNENSYTRSWPMKVFFYCEVNAPEGGMTPICDSHRVFERVPSEIRERFIEKKVMYVRNYGGGADLPWQEVFQTEDPDQVERFCKEAGIELEWLEGGRLRTRQICQAVARHPKTGKMLWFNQAHLFHISSLEPETREAMLEIFAEDELPRNALYGDGSSIETTVLDEIRSIYVDQRVVFPWQVGDILMLDNMAVAHARTPFRGERKIRVGMCEPVASDGIEVL